MKFVIFLTIGKMLLLVVKELHGQYTCDPATDCATSNVIAGDMVPNPNDCEQFYLCIESVDGELVPSTSSIHCQEGFYFDHALQSCQAETIPYICQNQCRQVCEDKCPDPFEKVTFVADKFNCSSYVVCEPVAYATIPCPDELPYFNGAVCSDDPTKCCDFCTPHCSKSGIQIQDPCDCHSYYICFGVGQPSDYVRFTCSTGTYYDEHINGCVPGICNDFCFTGQCLL